jgi:acyl-CoA hydrolase
MENYRLVLPEHLNHFGYLFGGHLLQWVDEVSWIAVSLDYPGSRFVTVAMDRVEFHRSVKDGSILRFDVRKRGVGNTSVQYAVDVYCDDIETGQGETVFNTCVTFVCLDEEGDKIPVPGGGDGDASI